jgi:ribonuclease H / adenosylcobalamin/alpha-ribazole phosphatase
VPAAQTRILLVRHAATDDIGERLTGRDHRVGLNQRGHAQATQLGHSLSAQPISALFTSPQRRAVETARAIAACRRDCTTRIEPALDECDFGAWAGRLFTELAADAAWQRFNQSRCTALVPGGESAPQLLVRALGVLDELSRRFGGGTIAVVTHAELIRSVVLHCRAWSLDRYGDVTIDPASTTTLRASASALWLDDVNLSPAVVAGEHG